MNAKDVLLWCVFVAVAFAIHYSPEVYFYFDEWELLSRFADHGFFGAGFRFDEHFLPVFFALQFVETQLFGSRYEFYILVSFLLHATNASLLYRVLQTLAPNAHARFGAALLSIFYASSALHAEVLHWAFVQCQLVSIGLLLLSYLFAEHYLRTGSNRSLALGAIMLFLAPLSFGNGLIFPLLLGVLVAAGCRRNRPRLLRLAGASVLAALLASALYLSSGESFGQSDKVAALLSDPRSFLRYLFVGSEYGTVLRSFGVFIDLGPEGAAALFPFAKNPATFAALVGFALSVLLLVLAVVAQRDDRRKPFSLWLLGQSFIVLSLVLPAFARMQLGAEQSLALRYQSLSLIGLCLMLLPLAQRHALAVTGFACLVFAQILPAKHFRYFVDYGITHRSYVERLVASRQNPAPHPEPEYPESIAWKKTPDEIYRAYSWLSRNGDR